MAHKVITPPTVEPITLDEAKTHLRLDGDPHADDAYVTWLISVVRDCAETYIGKSFATQTWESAQDYFPSGAIQLDGTALSIVSLKYIDENQVQQTMDPSGYAPPDSESYPSWLVHAVNTTWPQTYATVNAVRVRYVVGGTPLPKEKQGMLALLSHYYENREAVAVGATAVQVPLGVLWLWDFERLTMGV